jgi:hypothetical protein
LAVPALVMVVCCVLVVPTVCEPKASVVLVKAAWGVGTGLPLP